MAVRDALNSVAVALLGVALLAGMTADPAAATALIVEQVVDGDLGRIGPNPLEFAAMNDILYFAATEVANGRELWRSDGTVGGTWQILDAEPGQCSISPTDLTRAGGLLFFRVDREVGWDLWVSDGQASGTSALRSFQYSTSPQAAVGNTLFFGAEGKLWRSDGTTSGTVVVADLVPTPIWYQDEPRMFAAVGSQMFFVADTPTYGRELWITDGTAPGTRLVADIRPGALSTEIACMVEFNGQLLFRADDGVAGYEPWISDGTAAGTHVLRDINPGSASSGACNFVTLGSTALMYASDGVFGGELWRTDGTDVGTLRLSDAGPGSANSDLRELVSDGTIAWMAIDSGATGTELWRSDGTVTGTTMVASIHASKLVPLAGSVIFSGRGPSSETELWRSDGTGIGTTLLFDINGGAGSSAPGQLIAVGPQIFFAASETGLSNDRALWRTDGTGMGTYLVRNIDGGGESVAMDQQTGTTGPLFFRRPYVLWTSDGTEVGTTQVGNLSVSEMQAFGSGVLMAASDGTGTALWRSDGTPVGTLLVADIFPDGIVVNGPIAHFWGLSGPPLCAAVWRTDGTMAGTVSLGGCFNPNSYPRTILGAVNGIVYLAVASGDSPMVLANDGTPDAFTFLLQQPDWDFVTILDGFALGNTMLISEFTNTWWRSDGTQAGTVPLGGSPTRVSAQVGTGLLFESANGDLWRTDGTAPGTLLVKNMPTTASIIDLTAMGSNAYFYGSSSNTGHELWRSNGTAPGTYMVKDIRPGSTSSISWPTYQTFMTALGNYVYFAADDGTRGCGLWRSDGTTAGTEMVWDPLPGECDPCPLDLTVAGDNLFFMGELPDSGRELWRAGPPICGNARIEPDEQCDDGNPITTDQCGIDCAYTSCGDSVVQTPNGIASGGPANDGNELCDDGGDSASCDADCTLPSCGDLHANPAAGEQCDDGVDTRTCDADCTLPLCGDSHVNVAATEQCDDGNVDESDLCSGSCRLTRCGDGIPQSPNGTASGGPAGDGFEACDDAGDSSGCDADCTPPVCGDGHRNVFTGESCDDGNTISGDGCAADCSAENCQATLYVVAVLKARRLGTTVELSWTSDPFASLYHVNAVDVAADLIDPRRAPGNGTGQCDAPAPQTSCVDPDPPTVAGSVLFYQVLEACGATGIDEGPH